MSWSQEGAHDQWRTCTWTPLHMTSQQGCTIYRTLSPIVVVNIDRYLFLKCGLCCAPITRGRTRPKASLISRLNKRVPPAAAVLSYSVDWCLEKKVRQEKTITNQNTKIAKANVWKQIPVRPSGNPGNNNSDPPPGRTADDYLPKTRRTEAMLFDIHKDASSKYNEGLKSDQNTGQEMRDPLTPFLQSRKMSRGNQNCPVWPVFFLGFFLLKL